MRLAVAFLIAAGAASTAGAQPRATIDSLVLRITAGWAIAPCATRCVEWTLVRGDSTALRAATAEVSGSDRTGTYTVTMRPSRFAAPALVARLHIGHEQPGVVASHTIIRGQALDRGDVELRSTLEWGAPDRPSQASLAAVLGTEARRMLREGEPIRPGDVIAPPVVRAGDVVTAEVVRAGVRLALAGTALQNASLGGRVAIRLDRGRRLAGVATGRNTVRLD
ncbi:MAG: flagellar basal body P-ring formation protein FlgA [Gemmatimonadaceae bacterium]|nr:flagellar basal body P-ring formation protein FlgA [Gemmatimonadaceae bacterium]